MEVQKNFGFNLIFLKNDEINFHVIHLLGNEDQAVDECDGLVKRKDIQKMIQNRKLQFMSMDGGLLEYKYISKNENSRVYCRFTIHLYKNMNNEVISMGRPVILQFQDKDQMHSFTVCCCEQEVGVYVKQDFPVPSAIDDLRHDALFFLRDIQGLSGMRCLESAKWPHHFLGTSEGDDTDPQKVVLRKRTNETIERLSLMLINPKDLGL